MNPVTHPLTAQDGTALNFREWLDALAAGTCDQPTFVRAVDELLEKTPDDGWELLSLIDQYYRRGKIKPDAFRSLNAHLQSVLMGTARDRDAAQRAAARGPATHKPAIPVGVYAASGSRDSAPTAREAARPTQPLGRPPSVLRDAAAPREPVSREPVLREPAPQETLLRRVMPPRTAMAPASESPGTPVGSPRRPLAPGDVLRDRYRLVAILGRGSVGTVFQANDNYRQDGPGDGRDVAVKVLESASAQNPELLTELRREFQDLQALSHPNILRVHEFDRDGDSAFFTMECLSGLPLGRVLTARDESALYQQHALAILRDVGAALVHAHARDVVHGDLNPGNIFVTDGGDTRILNFGATHRLHHGLSIGEFDHSQKAQVAPSSYASCQILEGEPAVPRDDIYAFACLAYVLLTGRHPYQHYTAIKARTLRLTADRPTEMSRRQWQTLQAGLAFSRDDRPSDMRHWLAKLDFKAEALRLPALPVLLRMPPRRSRHSAWLGVGACTLLVCFAAGWALQHADSLRPQALELRERASEAFDRGRVALTSALNQVVRDDASSSDAPAAGSRDAAPDGHLGAVAEAVQPAPSGTSPHGRPAVPAAGMPLAGSRGTSATAAAASADAAAAVAQVPYPRARIELAADTVDADTGESVARIIVRRTGSLRGTAGFTWWTESGTAKPGQDFKAYAPQAEQFEEGQRALDIMVPITTGTPRAQERSFYVVIDEPSASAALGARTLTMVTIPARE